LPNYKKRNLWQLPCGPCSTATQEEGSILSFRGGAGKHDQYTIGNLPKNAPLLRIAPLSAGRENCDQGIMDALVILAQRDQRGDSRVWNTKKDNGGRRKNDRALQNAKGDY